MRISFELSKREATLLDHGPACEDAAELFSGPTYYKVVHRRDYSETRIFTVGSLRGRLVIVVRTQRAEARNVMSMRKASDREQARYRQRLG